MEIGFKLLTDLSLKMVATAMVNWLGLILQVERLEQMVVCSLIMKEQGREGWHGVLRKRLQGLGSKTEMNWAYGYCLSLQLHGSSCEVLQFNMCVGWVSVMQLRWLSLSSSCTGDELKLQGVLRGVRSLKEHDRDGLVFGSFGSSLDWFRKVLELSITQVCYRFCELSSGGRLGAELSLVWCRKVGKIRWLCSQLLWTMYEVFVPEIQSRSAAAVGAVMKIAVELNCSCRVVRCGICMNCR